MENACKLSPQWRHITPRVNGGNEPSPVIWQVWGWPEVLWKQHVALGPSWIFSFCMPVEKKKNNNKKAIYMLSSQCRVRNCELRWSQAPWVLLENTTAESGLRFLSVLIYHLMSSLAVSEFFSPGLSLSSVTGERDTSNTCIPSWQRAGTPTIFSHHCSWEHFTYTYNFFCTNQSTRNIFVVVVGYLAISNGSKQFFVYKGRCLHRTSY